MELVMIILSVDVECRAEDAAPACLMYGRVIVPIGAHETTKRLSLLAQGIPTRPA